MSSNKKLSGVVLATAAAGLFALAPVVTYGGTEAGIKCVGANSCKGTSACKTATNSCAGQNACKGQGFVTAESEEACTELGGTVATE